jgi:uncharacterized cupin superfamily protein
MPHAISNINELEYEELESQGLPFRTLDLSGVNLGVHIEEIPPGAKSSRHHYHSLEEEHVLVLAGSATLHLGSDEHELKTGDHVCFPAGEAEPHHIENRSNKDFKFLVFGERKEGDVVFYPQQRVMLVKALGAKLFKYEPR